MLVLEEGVVGQWLDSLLLALEVSGSRQFVHGICERLPIITQK